MPDEVIDRRTNDLGEHDDNNPYEFVISDARLFGGAIYNHPDPKYDTGQEDQPE
jgi:hypothetical protein